MPLVPRICSVTGITAALLLSPFFSGSSHAFHTDPAGVAASDPQSGESKESASSSSAAEGDPARAAFEMVPARRSDAYGPRPEGVPRLSRDQIVRFGLQNPLVKAAEEKIAAMEALLQKARFAWVPVIKTSAVLTPGANIVCDDVQLDKTDGSGSFDFQYCRSGDGGGSGAIDDANDLQSIDGYFKQLAKAGVSIQVRAETGVPLYTFGKLLRVKELGKLGVALTELERQRTEQETILKIHEAHTTLLLARSSIRLLREVWEVVQEERVKIETDLGGGLDDFDTDPETLNPDRDPDDLLELEVSEVDLARKMREARKIESLALSALWAVAGEAAPPYFDISESELESSFVGHTLRDLSYYQEEALHQRPEAKMSEGYVRLRKTQEKLARSNFFPDLGLVMRAGLGYANKADRDMGHLYYTGRLNYSSFYLGLGLTWNLDFHNDAFDLRRARAQRREAEFQREAARKLLGLEVEKAYRALLDAEADMRLSAKARDTSRKLVVSQQQRQSVGGGDFEKLQKALTKWAEYEFEYLVATQGRNVALAKLSRAVGAQIAPPQPLPAPPPALSAPKSSGQNGSEGEPERPAGVSPSPKIEAGSHP